MAETRTDRLKTGMDESAKLIASLRDQADAVAAISEMVIDALKAGHKLMTAGNGGSAAEALHMAEELVGRFRHNRVALPGISLVADTTALTCIGNDFGFDCIFSRQVEALGKPGDVLVLFSTSGNSRNLCLALDAARAAKVKTVCFLGRGGGAMAGRGDGEVIVAGKAAERIQEAHQVLMHLILDEIERAFPVAG